MDPSSEPIRLAALAREVAACLPEGWDAEEAPRGPGAIGGPDGMRLVLGASTHGGRTVEGKLPVDVSVSDLPRSARARCRVRVALVDEPDAIARAIIERLLPEYVPLFRQLDERARASGAPGASDGSSSTGMTGHRFSLYPRTARWTPEEFSRRMRALPHRFELVDGRLVLTEAELDAMLALTVELLGTERAVRVGPAEAWRQAVGLL